MLNGDHGDIWEVWECKRGEGGNHVECRRNDGVLAMALRVGCGVLIVVGARCLRFSKLVTMQLLCL